MSDPYPSTLEIEIDRVALRKYLRRMWFSAWAVPLCLFGGMIGFGRVVDALDHQRSSAGRVARELFERTYPTRADIWFHIAMWSVVGALIGLVVAALGYFVFCHRAAARRAASLQVTVEGAFLRIRQDIFVRSDRKLHFRSIVDYEVTQDFAMRRAGIEALRLRTTSGTPHSILTIPAVKDCLKVRDMLSEIDALREKE